MNGIHANGDEAPSNDIRPGFFTRDENFSDVEKIAEGELPPKLTRADIAWAMMLLGETLGKLPLRLLIAYVQHIDLNKVPLGKTSVWASSERLCTLLKCKAESLRRAKKGLEKSGLIIRRYNQANKPLENGGVDLRPFFCRLESMLATIEERKNVCKAESHKRREENRSLQSDVKSKNSGGSPSKSEGLKYISSKTSCSNVISFSEKDKLADSLLEKSEFLQTLNSQSDIGLTEIDFISLSEMIYEALRSAPYRDDSLAKNWLYAARKLGVRAIEFLIVSVETAGIKNRSGYFYRLLEKSDSIDLSGNLSALKNKKPVKKRVCSMPDKYHDNAFLNNALSSLGEENFFAWLAPVDPQADTYDGCKYSVDDLGNIILLSKSKFRLERINVQYLPKLRRIALSLGYAGIKVAMDNNHPNSFECLTTYGRNKLG